MARRMVLGRRGSASGLWISRTGFDALSATEAQLLFSMNARAGMVLASGSVAVPAGGAGRRVSFGVTFPSVPLVFCGTLWNYPINAAVGVDVDTSGFTVYAIADTRNGSFPAGGTNANWFAVMKTEN